MSFIVAALSVIAGVAILYQLTKNVGTAAKPYTGLNTASTAATSITSSLFSK